MWLGGPSVSGMRSMHRSGKKKVQVTEQRAHAVVEQEQARQLQRCRSDARPTRTAAQSVRYAVIVDSRSFMPR